MSHKKRSRQIWTFFSCRAWYYCKACHEKTKIENLVRRCKCRLSELKFRFVKFEKKKNLDCKEKLGLEPLYLKLVLFFCIIAVRLILTWSRPGVSTVHMGIENHRKLQNFYSDRRGGLNFLHKSNAFQVYRSRRNLRKVLSLVSLVNISPKNINYQLVNFSAQLKLHKMKKFQGFSLNSKG